MCKLMCLSRAGAAYGAVGVKGPILQHCCVMVRGLLRVGLVVAAVGLGFSDTLRVSHVADFLGLATSYAHLAVWMILHANGLDPAPAYATFYV